MRTSAKTKRYLSKNKDAKCVTNATYYKKNQKRLVQKQKVYNQKNKMKITQKQKVYDQKNKMKIAQKQKVYNQENRKEIAQRQKAYDQENRKEKAQKQKVYNRKNKDIIAKKQRTYDLKNREEINRKRQEYREKYVNKGKSRNQILEEMHWLDAAEIELLQYKPSYREFCGPETRREVTWMDPEQLVDCILYHQKKGHPEYENILIDYSFMSTSHEIPPWTNPENKIKLTKDGPVYNGLDGHRIMNPQDYEVGLSNAVLLPGDEFGFRGEEVTEDLNVIVKLKTMPTQPEAEKITKVTDWAISHSHLIAALKFWKRRDHLSLRGIRFQKTPYPPDRIKDWESTCKFSEEQRKENEVKVIKNWKYFADKPYHLLAKYHKNRAEEVRERVESEKIELSEDSDEEEDWVDAAGQQLLQDIPKYKKFCGEKTRRVVKWIDQEQLVDFINFYKTIGFPGFKDVNIDYKFMNTTKEFNPDYLEVGLCNSVIFPGKGEYSLFDGEEVTEPLNVILKLRTMPSQPEVEMDVDEDLYWWIDEEHLIQALRFWKTQDLNCLRGICFPDIPDKERYWGHFLDDDCWRWKNEEKVTKSWKHLKTKPYSLLAKYHKDLLEKFGIIGEDKYGLFIWSSEEKMSEYKFQNFSNAYEKQKNEFLKILSKQKNL